MSTPTMSDLKTDGIRVGATAFYLPDESAPEHRKYVFGYRIVIVNESPQAATLRNRHWVIIDGAGNVEEVRGVGVVGQQPHLPPGAGFKYTSFCPLRTEWGTMEGEYDFEWADGRMSAVKIGRFYLAKGRREANG